MFVSKGYFLDSIIEEVLEQLKDSGGGSGGGGGSGATPRLDQVLDPTADKTFDMGGHFLEFDFPIVGGHGGLQLYSTFAGAFPYGGATPLTIHTNITGSADHCIAVGMYLYGDGHGTGSRAGSYIDGILIQNLSWTAGPVEADSAAIRIQDQDGMATVGHEFALLIDDQSDSGAWAIKTGLGKVEFGDVVQFDGAVSGLGLDKINDPP